MVTRAEREAERAAKRAAKLARNDDGPSAAAGDGGDNGGTDSGIINLASVGGGTGTDDNSGERPRRKYRKRGSGSAGAEAPVSVRDALSGVFLTAHAIVAGLADNAVFAITPEQSENLGDAAAKVARHYVSFDGVAGPAFDWLNLGIICVGVYGPMIGAWRREVAARVPPIVEQPHAPRPTQSQPSKSNGAAEPADTKVVIPGVGVVDTFADVKTH